MSGLKLHHSSAILLITFVVTACSAYEKYGYGEIAGSRLDESQVTLIDLPENAPSISQRYRPVEASSRSEHRGFDILVRSGTPVLAASDGEVTKSNYSMIYGNQLVLDHGPGAAGFRIQTRYFHLDEPLASEGEKVRRGQLIGYSGVSGLTAGYPHLHFEVHQLNEGDKAVAIRDIDPQLYWVDGPGKITCYDSGLEYNPTPARLTYPVPCRGVEWKQ
jgi:murein DD-endopeptidase MepM/ murein hydrolase activator NlpD